MTQSTALKAIPAVSLTPKGILIPCNPGLKIFQALEPANKTTFMTAELRLFLQRSSGFKPKSDILLIGSALTREMSGEKLAGRIFQAEEVAYILASMLAMSQPLKKLFKSNSDHIFKMGEWIATITFHPEIGTESITLCRAKLSKFYLGNIILSSK